MSQLRWFKQISRDPLFKGRSPGQIVVILAASMLGLLMAVGVAIDTGLLYARQAQLSRAVDAAALAGVVGFQNASVTDGINRANAMGVQVMAANGITFTRNAAVCNFSANQDTFWTTGSGGTDYCGERRLGRVPGAVRYYVEARWPAQTYFVQIFGISNIRLRASAVSEYMPLVDLFSSAAAEYGIPSLATQSVYGPNICTSRGDAFFPWYNLESENGPFTTPQNAQFNQTGGAYTYRVVVPQSFIDDYRYVKIEFWDVDAANYVSTNQTWVGPDGATGTVTCNSLNAMCAQATNGYFDEDQDGTRDPDEASLYWFSNADEREGNGDVNYSNGGDHCGGQDQGNIANNNVVWRLYYYEQSSDGSLQPVDLAFYISKNNDSTGTQEIFGDEAGNHWAVPDYNPSWTAAQAVAEAALTDMNWVTPGLQAGSPHMQPIFTDVMNNAGNWTRGTASAGIDVPSALEVTEPVTLTEPCNTFRSHFYRSFENGGLNSYYGYYTTAPTCSPTTNNDFVVDLETEVPDIYRDSATGNVELYLQVMGIRGSGENAFEVWAGPSPVEDAAAAAPINGNYRTLHVANSLSTGNPQHSSRGVGIYAIGYMPMNMLVDDRTNIPLTYLGPQFAGQQMYAEMWDSDTGTEPHFTLFFDTIPQTDWRACWGADPAGSSSYRCPILTGENATIADTFWHGSAINFGANNESGVTLGSNRWTSFTFYLPGPGNPDGFEAPFYGARMVASYNGGRADTFTWRVSLDARPTLVE